MTKKDLGLLGNTASDDSTDPPSTSSVDDYPPELIAALRKEYDEWLSRRLVWRPIETAPKDGTDVLLYFPSDDDGDVPTGAHRAAWSGGYWWMVGHHCGGQLTSAWVSPTHWMPLPSPPKMAQAGRDE